MHVLAFVHAWATLHLMLQPSGACDSNRCWKRYSCGEKHVCSCDWHRFLGHTLVLTLAWYQGVKCVSHFVRFLQRPHEQSLDAIGW